MKIKTISKILLLGHTLVISLFFNIVLSLWYFMPDTCNLITLIMVAMALVLYGIFAIVLRDEYYRLFMRIYIISKEVLNTIPDNEKITSTL